MTLQRPRILEIFVTFNTHTFNGFTVLLMPMPNEVVTEVVTEVIEVRSS